MDDGGYSPGKGQAHTDANPWGGAGLFSQKEAEENEAKTEVLRNLKGAALSCQTDQPVSLIHLLQAVFLREATGQADIDGLGADEKKKGTWKDVFCGKTV